MTSGPSGPPERGHPADPGRSRAAFGLAIGHSPGDGEAPDRGAGPLVGGELGEPARVGRRAGWLLGGSFVVLVLAAVLVWVPLPYVIFSPGPVTNTLGAIDGQPIIDVSGAPTYPTTGELFFTTVRMNGGPGHRVNVYDVVAARIEGDAEILEESSVFPRDATAESVEEESTAEMADSQQVAAAVAQRAVGKKVPVEIYVDAVIPDGPSEGIVKKGDVILSIDGVAATSPATVRDVVLGHTPDEPVQLLVRRSGAEKPLTVLTRKAGDRAVIGIAMGTRYELPVDVDIHAGAVGGPSAGMMFSLAIYDLLTQGPLTGGQAIAGTGTIADSGAVGPIGGIRQKLLGARRGGARWFLAPADNCAEVVGHVPAGMRVVKVSTFKDALTAVKAIAAGSTEGLAACTK